MRNISLSVATLLVLLVVPSAHAAGVNLRWNNCFGDDGVANRTYSCNTPTGALVLVGSFVLGTDLLRVSGVHFGVDIATASATLPAWWEISGGTGCRVSALSANATVGAAAVNCTDWASGEASGGVATYVIGFSGPNTARLTGGFAVPASSSANLATGQEFFAFNVVITNVKTTGAGACAGCVVPACIALSAIEVAQAGVSVRTMLTGPTSGTDSYYALWQGGAGCAIPAPDTAGFAVSTSVVGRGNVTRSRDKFEYPQGSPLTIIAVPLPGDRFVSWSGDTSSTQDTLAIIVDRTRNYVATFERDPGAAPSVVAARDVPADQGGFIQVAWDRSPLEVASPGLLCCYELERRASTTPAAPWDDLGTIPATVSPSYELRVSTPADSTTSDPALFSYRVVAQAAGDTAQWISNEVDGHSVDNIPPPAPASISGVIFSGTATLFWPAVTAPDLAHYAVYRGLEALPPTDALHRIGTTTATSYNDSAGYFTNYRVSAVDTHGNQSPGTLFVPLNPAGVSGRSAPPALAVGNPTPSPMGQWMSMSLGLPHAMSVEIEVLDAQGRLVRRLGGGEWPAGWFILTWDARASNGHLSDSGIYFVRVRTPATERIRRLVVLR